MYGLGMSPTSVHIAAAAPANPTSEGTRASPTPRAASLTHATAAAAAAQELPVARGGPRLAVPEHAAGAATNDVAPFSSLAAPAGPVADWVPSFSPGDTVWIPSTTVGFTTAVVVAVDCMHQHFVVRRNRAASEELRAAQRGNLSEEVEHPSVLRPDKHPHQQEEPVEQRHHQQREEGVDSKVAAAARVDVVDFAEGKAVATLHDEDEESALSPCESSETYVRFTETWPYRPLPPPPAAVPEDAAALDSLSAASVLQLLGHRFLRKQIYTFAAHVLLAVNPCTTLPGLYGYDVVEVYRHWRGRHSGASAAALLGPRVAQYLGLSSSSSSAGTTGNPPTEGHHVSDSNEESIAHSNSSEDIRSCCTRYNDSQRRGSRAHNGSGGPYTGSTISSSTSKSDGSSSAARESLFPPAHPFAVAQDAHRRLQGEGQKQTIIVSGESGAGKTETSKILMLYLTEVGSLLPSSSCGRSTRIDRRQAGDNSASSSSEGQAVEKNGLQPQQLPPPLHPEDGGDGGQSRQAQRRAAAAALMHAAAAAKQATYSTFSPADCSPPPVCTAIRHTLPDAAPAGALPSSSDTVPQCGSDAPSASGSVSNIETQQSVVGRQAQGPAVGELQQRILSCNPVLEAFCNAKTRRNSNSSRVGRLTLLHYDRAGLLHGASIKTYLLESTRVCSHPVWERNFHVFYQLLQGCSKEDLESRKLQRCCSAYRLLSPKPAATANWQGNYCRFSGRRLVVSVAPPANATPSIPHGSAAAATKPPSPSQEEIDRDADSYGLLAEALSKTGFSAAEVQELFDGLAGLLHLSNVSFKEIPAREAGATDALVIHRQSAADALAGGGRCSSSGDGAAAAAVTDCAPAIECAAELLRLPLEQLEEVLLWETLTMRHETLRKQRRAEQAAAARDALIKCAYNRIVRFVLAKLNESVVTPQQPTHVHPVKSWQPEQSPSIKLIHPNSSSNSSSTGSSSESGGVAGGQQADQSENATAVETNRRGRAHLSSDSAERVAAAVWGTSLSIGILDIYGFECLDGGANGFEQLCINYANERQQQIFLQRAISEELRLYRCEGLLGVLSSLQPALLSSDSSSDRFAAAPAAPLSPCSSPRTPAARSSSTLHYGNISSGSRNNNSRDSSSSAGSESWGPALLLQRQHLYCEQQTEELLSYLTEGLFKRLDDNSRLRARGQQQRLDVHFWRDFFAFCRQRERQQQLAASSSIITGSSSNSRRGAAAAQQQLQQPPILFRLLRSGAGSSHPAAACAIKNEDSRSPTVLQRTHDAFPQQQQREKMQQLLAAGEVRPLQADAPAAASTLQQGVFVVRHFAGLVEYQVDGWLARNNDKAEAEIEYLLSLSRLRALQAAGASATEGTASGGDTGIRGLAAGWLLSARGRSDSPAAGTPAAMGGNTASTSSNRHFASVSQQFVADLRQLMGELQSKDVHVHFIRCFVSNRSMRPLLLDRALLLRQLQQSGTVALIHVLHKGFPHRVPLSPLAAVFKSKLHSCITAATAHLQQQQQYRNGRGGDEGAAQQLRRLQALRVAHIPDGRLETVLLKRVLQPLHASQPFCSTAAVPLHNPAASAVITALHFAPHCDVDTAVSAALELLPDCPRGAVSCGISLLFFKASAFLSATAFLRSPEGLFSRPDMLLRLQQEVTRRRWRVAVAVAMHVRRRLAWLLRRVRLLHVIKQRFISCAVRVLLLRRYIMRPLLLRVQKRAAAAAALKLLLRLLIARGFHAWVLAYRRATAAAGAAQSLAARVAAGKGEQVAVGHADQLQQQRQTHSSRPALQRRRRSKDDKAARRATAAAAASAMVKEGNHPQAESEELTPQQQPYLTQGPVSTGSGKAGEAGDASSLHTKKMRGSSLLQEARKCTASGWWRAALFSVSSDTTCSSCSWERYSTQTAPATTEAAAAAALTPTRREFYEIFLLFTGKQLYLVQLRVTQQLPQQSKLTGVPRCSAATAAKQQQQRHVIRCFALSFASGLAPERCRTQRGLCSEGTAWQALDQQAERQRQQSISCHEQQQQQQQETSHLQPQDQPNYEWRQQQDNRGAPSAQQEGGQRSNAEAAPVQPAGGIAGCPGRGLEYRRAPTLACIAQHARHPKLFVACDRQARIFLLPLHLPPFLLFPSVEGGSDLLADTACFDTVFRTAPDPNGVVTLLAEKQDQLQQEEQQHQGVQHCLLQQPFSLDGYGLEEGCSNEKGNSCSSKGPSAQAEAQRSEQSMTAEEKEEQRFLALCGTPSERQTQSPEELQLSLGTETLNVSEDTVKTKRVSSLEAAAVGRTVAACGNRETATAVSARGTAAPADAYEQLPFSDIRTSAVPHVASGWPSRDAKSVAAVGGVSGKRELPLKNSKHSDKFQSVHPQRGAAPDGNCSSDSSSSGNCDSNSVPQDNRSSNIPLSSEAVCNPAASSSIHDQRSYSSSTEGYKLNQRFAAEVARDAGIDLSHSASSVYADSEEINSSICSISSATKKKLLKSLGGGQPSTWLPALVPAGSAIPVCRRPATAAAAAAAFSSSSAAAGNPYLARFRRVAPLPTSAVPDALPSVTAVQAEQRDGQQQQKKEQQKELYLQVAPWVDVQTRLSGSSPLLLPRSCCFPHTVGPAAWVPPTLLERAEQRHEQAVLHHQHRQQQQVQQKERRLQECSTLQHQQHEEQQQQWELRRQKQLQQSHVTVRPVRIHFASSYSTQHVIVLTYVSAANSSSRIGRHDAGNRRNNTWGRVQQQQRGTAVVAGLWALVLVDLLRQRALDWKEIFAAESDVMRSAWLHRHQLSCIFPHAVLASHCSFYSSTSNHNSRSRAIDGAPRNSPSGSSCNSVNSKNNGGDSRTSCSEGPAKSMTTNNSRVNNISSATSACAVSPSQIVSTGLLESFGEGMWIVAGPGLLGLLQVRLRQASGYSIRGGSCGSKQNTNTRATKAANKPGGISFLFTHSSHTSEPEGTVEVLWNQARVQQFSRRRAGERAGDSAAAARSSLDVASTWFTGCMYTATPQVALQDIGPTHPLGTWGAFAPNSKAALLLQQHFQHLLLLASAAGDLLLLRWLPQKRRLRMLRRLPGQQQQTESAAVWRRFIRLQYAECPEEEEEAAAVEQLLSGRHGGCCCSSSSCLRTTRLPSTFRPEGTAVLRLSQVHPHALKQQQQQRRTSSENESRPLQGKKAADRQQRDAAREERKVPVRRWLDDVGALAACIKEDAQRRDLATVAGAPTAAAAGALQPRAGETSSTASVGTEIGAASTTKRVQVLHLEMPPLTKRKQSGICKEIVFAESRTELYGCSTSADSTTSEEDCSRSSEGGSGGNSLEPRHYRNSTSLEHSICSNGSDKDSQVHSSREPKQEGEENKSANLSMCLFDPPARWTRSNSRLYQAEPLPQRPDQRQQQHLPRRREQRCRGRQPEQQKQHLLQLGSCSPLVGVCTEKELDAGHCEAAAGSSSLQQDPLGSATASLANCASNETSAAATLKDGHVVAVAPLQSLKDALVILRTTEEGEPQLAVVSVGNMQQPTWNTLPLH